MNPQVIEYYENLFKYEIMQKQFDGARKTLAELVEYFLGKMKRTIQTFIQLIVM